MLHRWHQWLLLGVMLGTLAACSSESRPGGCRSDGDCVEPTPKCEIETGNCRAVVCGQGETRCGNDCVDLATDGRHCGDCATICALDQVCSNSSCQDSGDCRQTPCPSGYWCDLETGKCTSSSCADGDIRCGEVCVDPQSDPKHCGSCENVCKDNQICENRVCRDSPNCRITPCPGGYYCDLGSGQCKSGCANDEGCGANERCEISNHACVCVTDFHRCAGACLADQSVDHCGTRCDPCPRDPNGSPTCVDGLCGTTCGDGYLLCDDRCVACNDPNGAEACGTDGACLLTCYQGYHLCDGRCVVDRDVANCGLKCDACATDPNGTATCDGARCSFRCDTGYLLCGNRCISCSDPNGTASCGASGDCQIHCDDGYHQCDDVCVGSDEVAHCGSRCAPCPADPHGVADCVDRSCQVTCEQGYLFCGNACALCPIVPGATFSCSGSQCVFGGCQEGTQVCDGDHCCRWEIEDIMYGEYIIEEQQPVIAVDGEGIPYVACPGGTEKLSVLRKVAGSWTELGRIPGDPFYVSMALDSQGNPHLAYYQIGDPWQFQYARWNGSDWEFKQLEPGTPRIQCTSLALDSGDKPHIAYHSFDDGKIRFAEEADTGWSFQDVADITVQSEANVDLALDSLGLARIVFQGDWDFPLVQYFQETASGWKMEPVFDDLDQRASLVLGQNDVAHIVSFQWTSYDSTVYYSVRGIDRWDSTVVDPEAMWPDIALDAAGRPRIAYYDYLNGGVKWAEWTGSEWRITQVDGSWAAGEYLRMAVDPEGRPHLVYAYIDSSREDYRVRYAHLGDVAEE